MSSDSKFIMLSNREIFGVCFFSTGSLLIDVIFRTLVSVLSVGVLVENSSASSGVASDVCISLNVVLEIGFCVSLLDVVSSSCDHFLIFSIISRCLSSSGNSFACFIVSKKFANSLLSSSSLIAYLMQSRFVGENTALTSVAKSFFIDVTWSSI